jgi:dipeptidyl aminopeptidase/acylaminoacyl peptidase
MTYKKIKTRITKIIKSNRGLFLVSLAILVLTAIYMARVNYQLAHPADNGYILGRAEPDDAYKYLNLDVASKATYNSGTLSTVRDLGVARGVDHKVVQFQVPKDDLTENALLTLPTTPQPEKGYPVVILCHGYVNPVYYSTEKAYLTDMEFYSQHGFAVIKPDFRGQGFSITAGAPEGAYYSMAYNTDVMSLIAAIKATPYLDKNRINLWGHSMGAYVALRAGVLSPDIKNAVLLSGPVGNIQDMFSSYIAISDTNNPTAGSIRAAQLAAHGTPIGNPAYWNKTSPLNYLKNTKTTYQIHTGTADQIVPTRFSADLDNALTRAGKPHEYFIYPAADHGLVNHRGAIWQRSLAAFNKQP